MGRHEVGFQGDVVKIPVENDGTFHKNIIAFELLCICMHSILSLCIEGCRMEANFNIKKVCSYTITFCSDVVHLILSLGPRKFPHIHPRLPVSAPGSNYVTLHPLS